MKPIYNETRRRTGIYLFPLTTLLASHAVFSFPDLCPPSDSSGLAALRRQRFADALEAVLVDTGFGDTAFRYFKLGCAHGGLANDGKALFYFKRAAERDTVWGAFAYEKIGDIELRNGRIENALKSYRAALDGTKSQRYQHHLYSTMYRIVTDHSDEIGRLPWLEEIVGPPPAGIEVEPPDLVERLIGVEGWTELDSLVENLLDTSAYNQARCDVAARLVREPVPDSVLTTKALFRLSRIASQCRNYQAASDWLLEALGRPDFNRAVSERTYIYHRAELNYKMKNHAQALRWLRKYEKKYGLSPEVVYMIARCHRALGHGREAAEWYVKFTALYPRHSMTPDILWYLAWEKEDEGDIAAAREIYRKMFTDYGRRRRADEAMFRYALTFVKNGLDSQAIAALTAFAGAYGGSPLLPGARYFKARSLLTMKKADKARTEFRALIQESPLDYYALKARAMLVEMGDSAARFTIDSAGDDATAQRWIDSIFGGSARPLTPGDSAALRIGLALSAVGMDTHADYFLEPLELCHEHNIPLQYGLSRLYSRAGDITRSFAIARRLTWRIPAEHRRSMPRSLYRIMYPEGFSGLVGKYAREYGVEPELIYAIMRQESVFNPAIVSPAGAIGLMQIMPYTGQEIADALGDKPFSPDSLYTPDINVRFGSYYISRLLNEFNGNLVCAIAGYNGGPHNVRKWYERNKNNDADLFIEDIGFTETRTYVKKVLANYWIYKEIARNGAGIEG